MRIMMFNMQNKLNDALESRRTALGDVDALKRQSKVSFGSEQNFSNSDYSMRVCQLMHTLPAG